ncbi:beta strand repeat-containing protein [Candidatus Margulisiibacteriota bacterium]
MKIILRVSIYLMLGVFLFISQVSAAVPTKINYEGRLMDASGNALSGSYNMRFSLTSDSAGSNVVWGPESHSSVDVSNGLFSVYLGSTTAITTAELTGATRYLKVEVASPATSTTNYETLTPSSQLASVAYAIIAEQANAVAPDINITTTGTVSAASFVGDGSALTGISSGVGDYSITTTKIATSAVTSEKLAGNIAVNTTGIVTASAYYGDGSNLTGLPGGGDINAVTAGAGLTGGGTSGAVTLAVSFDATSIGLSAGSSLEVKDNGITSAKIQPNTIVGADLATDIAITTSGSLSAVSVVGAHYGDGSSLSGITADSAAYAALAGTATTAASATTADSTAYAVLAGTATSAASATTADSTAYAALAGTATTAASATSATNAGYATLAGTATSAAYAPVSGTATTAASATSADYAVVSGTATTAASATTADSTAYAALAGTATTAASATSAGYATLSGTATNSGYASLSGTATNAGYATLSGTASTAADVSDNTISAAKMQTDSVTTEAIVDGTIAAADLAPDAAVLTLAEEAQTGLTGHIELKEGSNILLTQTGQTIEIAASTGGGTVTSVGSGTGLTGGPINISGSLSVAQYGITATLIATNAVTSEKIQDSAITGADLATDISISTTGTVTATAFYGDGSALSGVTVDTASYAILSGTATNAAYADVAGTATNAATATTADMADYATVAGTATTAASATTADMADYATMAGTATTAASATTADTADYATVAGTATLAATVASDITISTSGDITAYDGTYNGSLTVEGTLFYVDSLTNTFEVIEVNHGPTTVALTIRPSVESEGQSSIQVFRVNSSASPTFEVTSDGGVVGRLFTGDGSGLTNVNASSVDSGAAVLSFASQEAARLTGNVDLKPGSGVSLTQTGQTIEIAASSGGGTVTQVDSGTGLTGGPVTGVGTIAATYGGSGSDWGSADSLARSDHLHDAAYVELSGDVMTGILRVPTLEVSASVYMWESGNNFYLYDPNAGSKTLSQLYTGVASQGATRLTGNVDLKAGSNVTLTQTGQTVEIASIAGSGGIYGELYCADNSVAQSVNTTYVTVNALTMEGVSSGTTLSSANKRITVNSTGIYRIQVAMAFSGSNNQTFYGAVSRNGTVPDKIVFVRKLGTGGDVGSANCSGLLSLTAGDWVDVRVKSTASNSIIVQWANLSISKL